jgi:peptidoglycan/LPS O-acetylase OafA/YrhL
LLNLVFLGDGRWINGSFWSIAVEVKFYVLLAAMAAFVRDAARLARIFAWVAVLAAPVWMAAAIYGDLGHSTLPARLISLTTIAPYLPFFAVGILARMRQAGKLRAPLLLAAAQAEGMGFLILDTGDGGATGWGAGLLSAVVMLVLFQLLIRYADGKALPHIPYLSGGLAKIGFISFSWYLIHENLGIGFLATLDRYLPAWAAVLVALAATLLIASVFSEAVEWRFRKPAERLALNVLGRIAPARLKGPLATGRGA